MRRLVLSFEYCCFSHVSIEWGRRSYHKFPQSCIMVVGLQWDQMDVMSWANTMKPLFHSLGYRCLSLASLERGRRNYHNFPQSCVIVWGIISESKDYDVMGWYHEAAHSFVRIALSPSCKVVWKRRNCYEYRQSSFVVFVLTNVTINTNSPMHFALLWKLQVIIYRKDR